MRNLGDGASAPTTLRYYRSTDAIITTSDTEVGTSALRGIAASGSTSVSVELTAPARAGTYYYGACADAVADETDTSNNCSSAVQVVVQVIVPEPQGHPDLAVTAPSVSDATPAAGASFTLSATVSNAGAADAAATTLCYYQSTDATITTSDTEVGMDTIAALGPAGSSSRSLDLTAPASPGTYYYGACVDAVTDESDTKNNCSSAVPVVVVVTATARQGHPELVARTPLVTDNTPAAGAQFTLSATVSNLGAGNAAATTLRFYRSTDATIATSDTEVGTALIAALGAAGSNSRSVGLTAPASPGTYYYGACVDPVTDESDSTNNCSTAVQVTVTQQQPREPRDPQQQQDAPDLTVATPTVTDNRPAAGAQFTLSVTVSNTGNRESPSTTLRYYQSTDATITSSDTAVGTDAVGTLAASGSSAESVDLTAPGSSGTYYYGACVDAVTDESDTTNNCSASVEVNVVARRVDISPRTLTLEAVGASKTVTVRVLDKNGDEDTDASYGWIFTKPPGGPCCTLMKADDGLKVTMNKAGNLRVVLAATNAQSATLQVTAYQKATSLEVSPNSVSLDHGTDTLSATVKDANGNAIRGSTIYWTTSDSGIATVQGADAGGETGATATVTAVAAGTATVTARHAVKITGTATVTVTEKSVAQPPLTGTLTLSRTTGDSVQAAWALSRECTAGAVVTGVTSGGTEDSRSDLSGTSGTVTFSGREFSTESATVKLSCDGAVLDTVSVAQPPLRGTLRLSRKTDDSVHVYWTLSRKCAAGPVITGTTSGGTVLSDRPPDWRGGTRGFVTFSDAAFKTESATFSLSCDGTELATSSITAP